MGRVSHVVLLCLLLGSSSVHAAPCQGYGGVVFGGDCRKQWCPHPLNDAEYPKWPYCKRVPNDPDTRFDFIWETMPPADVPYHQCGAGKVLRPDASGMVCRNPHNDFEAGECIDEECCTQQICSSYTCPTGWTLKGHAADIDCYFGCTEADCCELPTVKKLPRQRPMGLLFVDKDPARFVFGGNATILRAIDESDITHYRVYWGFVMAKRKAPSCELRNPVSWNLARWMDKSKLYAEFPKTGCDITFEIPMGTKATDYQRCPISLDRRDQKTGATDKCNPHLLVVVSVNENGERSSFESPSDLVGPVLAISDYEEDLGMTCAESGVVGGADLIAVDDAELGARGSCPTPAECAQRCREYDGEKGRCRMWTWTYPSGGPNSNSCWMESQSLQMTHYTVRITGPAVCPTRNESSPPTGRERPKCTRWQRFQNALPFPDGDQWKVRSEGINYVQRPLGPYESAEMCKSLCDMDVMCVGFYYQKALQLNRGDNRLLKMCRILHVDSGERHDLLPDDGVDVFNMVNLYDTWFCTREGKAPLVNGYAFQRLEFGYIKCEDASISRTPMENVDCCAFACDEDATCGAFTFWNGNNECELFRSCSSQTLVEKVEGCTYESCFDGFGASTYLKIQERKMQIVDQFPRQGTKDGIPVSVQTNGMMNGAEVVCAARRRSDDREEFPETAAELKALNGTNGEFVKTAIVVNDVAMVMLTQEMGGQLYDGLKYQVRCAVVEHTKYNGLPAFVDSHKSFQLQEPKGYRFMRHGRCIGYQGCEKLLGDERNKGVSYDDCLALSNNAAESTGFSWGMYDGWCRVYSVCPPQGVARDDGQYYCFKKTDEWEDFNDPGQGECDNVCPFGDTCSFKHKMGVQNRNVFTPSRDHCGFPPTAAPATNVPTAAPATNVPSAAPATGVPDVATSGPGTKGNTKLPSGGTDASGTGAAADDDGDGTSPSWWLWVLIVAGALLLVILAAYMFTKWRAVPKVYSPAATSDSVPSPGSLSSPTAMLPVGSIASESPMEMSPRNHTEDTDTASRQLPYGGD
ncbi:hypothetical protein DIPPA_02715 [Diplonema papillatum]|nr:hypothetical protein DIPPA_02715 [Diplonema papillatum]